MNTQNDRCSTIRIGIGVAIRVLCLGSAKFQLKLTDARTRLYSTVYAERDVNNWRKQSEECMATLYVVSLLTGSASFLYLVVLFCVCSRFSFDISLFRLLSTVIDIALCVDELERQSASDELSLSQADTRQTLDYCTTSPTFDSSILPIFGSFHRYECTYIFNLYSRNRNVGYQITAENNFLLHLFIWGERVQFADNLLMNKV